LPKTKPKFPGSFSLFLIFIGKSNKKYK
jgi:hypothetical protein